VIARAHGPRYCARVSFAQRVPPWMYVSAAWLGPAILGGLDVVMQHRLRGAEAPVPEVLFVTGDWLLYALLTPAVFAIASRWPLARPHLARRATLHGLISIAFCAAWAGAGTVLRALLQPEALAGGVVLHFVSWFFITLPFGVAVYLAVIGIEHAIRYFAEARDREIQMARLSEQLAGARFAALQAQLNPHFLFNTLNTIAVLVRDGNRAGAVQIVEQLSDLLRRILSRHRANEVRLGDELDLIRQYLAIEQARFPDRLRVTFDIDDTALSGAVPSFALQHLVENAVRHGIAKREQGGHVKITARRADGMLELAVHDNGVGIAGSTPVPLGRGLENTRERLRGLYGEHATLVVTRGPAGGTMATIRIPFRELLLEAEREAE
jgi:two-component system, LytTR family, sensor kinase